MHFTNVNEIGQKFLVLDDDTHYLIKIKKDRSEWIGGIRVYKFMMQKKLGRELTDDEEVHHIDKNHFNNELSNLELKTTSEHQRQHKLGIRQELSSESKALKSLHISQTLRNSEAFKAYKAKGISEETRRKMSEARKGKKHPPRTPEQIAKLSAAKKGLKLVIQPDGTRKFC
jgi:hypothetical protein